MTRDGWAMMGTMTLVAGLAVALVVTLYLLKRRFGSQQWRRKAPHAVMLGLSRGVGAVVRKVPWKPLLIWGPWVLMIAGVAWYQVENWRGARAWTEMEAGMRERGETLSLTDLLPDPSADQNIAEHPVFREYFRHSRSVPLLHDMSGLGLGTVDVRIEPASGESKDVRTWFPTAKSSEESEVARQLLARVESDWADLDRFAEALRRPACRFDVAYHDDEWPSEPPLFREVSYYLPSAFRERAFLRAKAGEGAACAEDLHSLLHAANRLHGIPSLMSHVIRLGCLAVRHGVVWEALRLQILSEEELLEMDQAIASIDLCAGLARSLQAERAILVGMIEQGKNRRGELVEELGLEIDTSDDWDENLRRIREQIEVRFAPAGWFDLQKIKATKEISLWIRLLSEGDRSTIRRELNEEVQGYHSGLRGLDSFQHWGPALEMSLARTLRLETTLTIERIAIAAERYRLRHREYPPDGAALVPEFLSAWPNDARSGDPIVYQRKADGTPWIHGTATFRRDVSRGRYLGGRSGRGRRGIHVDGWQYTPSAP